MDTSRRRDAINVRKAGPTLEIFAVLFAAAGPRIFYKLGVSGACVRAWWQCARGRTTDKTRIRD